MNGTGHSSHGEPLRRLLVTVIGCAVCAGLGWIELPVLDLSNRFPSLPAEMRHSEQLGILALGVMPLLSAAVLVELAAVLVPRWRHLRLAGRPGRARLWRWTLLVALLLAVVQSFFIVRWLESLLRLGGSFQSRLVMMGSLTAGMALLVALATFMSDFGLVNGFSALLALDAVKEVVHGLRASQLSPFATGAELVRGAIPALVLGAIAVWAVNRHRKAARPGTAIPLPASGLMPLIWALSLPGLLDAVAVLVFGASLGSHVLAPEATSTLLVQIAVVLTVAPFWACVFNGPRRLSWVWERAGADATADLTAPRAALRRAIVHAVLLLLAAGAVHVWLGRIGARFGVGPLMLLVVVGLDLIAEWRARAAGPLVNVWPMHRPYAVDAVLAALRRAGIAAHAVGLHHRALLQFFGPYVAIRILVPREHAEQAHEIIAGFVPPAPALPSPSDDDDDSGP